MDINWTYLDISIRTKEGQSTTVALSEKRKEQPGKQLDPFPEWPC
jgi:hypothetical protein